MRIDFAPIDLRAQKVVKQYETFIEMFPERLDYKNEFMAKEPKDKDDHELGWEKVMRCFQRSLFKRNISCVDLEYVQPTTENKNVDMHWTVVIQVLGIGNDLVLFFKDEATARDVYAKILKWLFEN